MSHSLRSKLSGLRHKGILEDKDYKRLCHALDLEKAEQESCDDAISRQKALLSLTGEDLPKDRDKYIALANERIKALPPVNPQEPKTGQWRELKETITELRDNDGTGTQQEVCKFLVNYMEVLEKQMQESKTGHWIYDKTLENWRCSKCNETPKTMGYVGTADFMAEHFEFCNHCGAKMVEPQESEE